MHHSSLLISTLLSTLVTSLLSVSALAQISAGNARYQGSGCPEGSASIVFAPDSSAISILYSGMNVSSDMAPLGTGQNGRRPIRLPEGLGTASCTVDIDIQIPVGMQLELTSVDYRGAVELPDAQSNASMTSTTYFIGGTVDHAFGRQPGNRLIGGTSMIKKGPLSEPIFWQANYAGQGRNGYVTGKHISACKGQANLKITTSASTRSTNPAVVSYLFLDSADAAFSAQYGLTLKPCDAENRKREKLCSRGTCT